MDRMAALREDKAQIFLQLARLYAYPENRLQPFLNRAFHEIQQFASMRIIP